MDALRAPIWDFIERCGRATTVVDVETAFMNEATRLGYEHVAMISHVAPIAPPKPGAIAFLRYPKVWIDYYTAEDLGRVDPVIVFADKWKRPFDWREPEFLAGVSGRQAIMMAEARETGIADGLTIPIMSRGAYPAACTFIGSADGVDPTLVFQAHIVAHTAHEAALRLLLDPATQDRRPLLSQRERECLMLVAQGKSDGVIGEILVLADRTVHHTIERAKNKLGVASRIQAVVRALHLGEISFDQAIDWRARG